VTAAPRQRQEERTRATRAALVAAARRLFAERGYAAVTAEDIVAAAGLTRGALRHHFGDKRVLFRAVLEQVEREITERIAAVAAADTETDADVADTDLAGADPWAALRRGLAAFLDACEEPEIVQIALTDAPAVLGWAEWRAVEADHGLGLLTAALEAAAAGPTPPRQPVGVLAHLVLAAAIEAALLIARAPDRRAARASAEQALLALLAGLGGPAGPAGSAGTAGTGRAEG
jgi:AcrR family transcriptional regulator